jgi:hypothetical protein
MQKIRSLLLGTIATTTGLLTAVIIWRVAENIIFTGEGSGFYPSDIVFFGIIAESIRGFLLAYLYSKMKNAGASMRHAIEFGIIASLLVGSLWVVLGYAAYPHTDPAEFLVSETAIILTQGILSGIGLGLVHKNYGRQKVTPFDNQ